MHRCACNAVSLCNGQAAAMPARAAAPPVVVPEPTRSAAPAGASGRSVLILGGTSAIAVAIAEALLGQQSGPVVVAARDLDRAEVVADRLRSAGATEAFTIRFNGAEVHEAERVVAEAVQLLKRVDVVIVAFGNYVDSDGLAGDLEATLDLVTLNFLGAIAVGEALTDVLRSQRSGRIIAVSSRPNGWTMEHAGTYAASKAGFDTYFASLAVSLRPVGADVLVIRPPGVNTPLIENHSSFLTPEEVAVEVVQAFSDGMAELTILSREERRLARRSFPRKLLGRVRRDMRKVSRRIGV
ncbi:MAG: SDR family NAD(P)-dependent oxidoreductase [Actinobacteria bacterium]|nr:SDR family NAD(P)-dependent oxidoreductase [Actinomycetota bacterium]